MADLRTIQTSFGGGEVSPAIWPRVDLAKFSVALRVAENVFIHPEGGASNRAGLEFVGEVKNSANPTRLIPFQFNTEQSYILEFGNLYGRVYRDGGVILSGMSPYEFTTPYVSADLATIVYTQEADVTYLTEVGYAPRKLSRLADNNWPLTTPTFAPTQAAPAAPTVTKPGDTSGAPGYTPTVYSYKIAAVSAEGEESLPSAAGSVTNDLSISGGKNRATWASVAGAVRYVVYKLDNGVYGYIGGTEGLSFDDENITADLADTPQVAYNPFVGAGNYPRCSTFLGQRLVFASTLNNPQAVWESKVTNYENFGYSRPRKASDAFEYRIRGKQVNEIRALLPRRALLAFTSGGEWLISGGTESKLPTPDFIDTDSQTNYGSGTVQPLLVGKTVLFTRGNNVWAFKFDFSGDAFDAKNLTILSRHIFKGRGKRVKAWAYAQTPHSLVWVVFSDGTMASFTYLEEHDIWAWTRHVTDGVFEDVAVIEEDGEDIPYFIVRRTIGGGQKRYIERMRSRDFDVVEDAFFVDSGLSYSGAPISTVFVPHLAGKDVVALVDGNVVRGLVAAVGTGQVTLPNAGAKIHIGLPYTATMGTLDVDLGAVSGMGTVQGRKKSIGEVTLRVENTRGIWIGPVNGARDSTRMVEFKQRSTEAWNEAIQLYTGDIAITPMWDWTDGGRLFVKQFDPLPLTIGAIIPEVMVASPSASSRG